LLLMTKPSPPEDEMARKPRILQDNAVYHVFNRRTDRQQLFPSSRAFDDFPSDGNRPRVFDIRLYYCLMETVASGDLDGENGAAATSRYLRWLSEARARFRVVSDTRGHRHVYQDRQVIPVRR
jgi:hypothetical protein